MEHFPALPKLFSVFRYSPYHCEQRLYRRWQRCVALTVRKRAAPSSSPPELLSRGLFWALPWNLLLSTTAWLLRCDPERKNERACATYSQQILSGTDRCLITNTSKLSSTVPSLSPLHFTRRVGLSAYKPPSCFGPPVFLLLLCVPDSCARLLPLFLFVEQVPSVAWCKA